MKFPNSIVFRAIWNTVRQNIISEIKNSWEITVSDLISSLWLSQATVSHHVSVLKRSWILRSRREKTFSYYRLNFSHFINVIEELRVYLSK